MFSVSDTKTVKFSKGNLQLVGENTWKFADNQWDYFGDTQSDNHRDLFGWCTLSLAEWTYLLNTREGNRYCKATVHSTTGLIIFPDEITWNPTTMGAAPTTCNNKKNNFTYSPTDANWAALEAAGCVFLPAAGERNGSSVSYVGSLGSYWSITHSATNEAYSLYFFSFNVNPAYNRYYGRSVRLVQNQ